VNHRPYTFAYTAYVTRPRSAAAVCKKLQ